MAALIAIIVAGGVGGGAILLAGGAPAGYLSLPAALLVVGGALGAAALSFPLPQMAAVPSLARWALLSPVQEPGRAIHLMVGLAQRARRQGILALEEDLPEGAGDLLVGGVRLVADGVPGEMAREVLETGIEMRHELRRQGEQVLATAARYATAFGLVGALLCLIRVLRTHPDPASLGPATAGALLPALYGLALAHGVLLPISARVRARSDEEVSYSQMMMEGLLAIQSGDSPRMVEARMQAYASPRASATVRAGRQ